MALSALLLANFNGRDWLVWLVMAWPGNLMIIGAGYGTGRLHDEFLMRAQILEEMRLRDRYLTLINITVRDILTPKNIEDRYHDLVNHLVNLFVADYAYLVRWDATREQAILADLHLAIGSARFRHSIGAG